jgi:hypothetical protein
MNKINYWIASDDTYSPICLWRGKIANGRANEEFLATVDQIYDFAREEELYRLIHKVGSDNQIKTLPYTFYDLDWVRQEDGILCSMTKDGMKWYGCEQQAKISYYSNDIGHEGEIVTDWVGMFVSFQRKLRPELDLIYDVPYGTLIQPVVIEYQRYGEELQEEWYEIILCTDIWFPRVIGWMDAEEPFYDNSELAALNTPRLNRFLQRTKELILSLGGTWELAKVSEKENVHNSVTPYLGNINIAPECEITEDGINLELKIKSRNHWCIWNTGGHSMEGLPFWEARFSGNMFKSCQDFWPLVKTILEVGQSEEILRIFADEADFYQFINDIESGILPIPSFEDIQKKKLVDTYMKELGVSIPNYSNPKSFGGLEWQQTNATSNFELIYLHNIVADTRICYYDVDGEIVERYHDKLAETLLQLYDGDDSRHFKEFANPNENIIRIDDTWLAHRIGQSGYKPSFRIMIPSDIWFPHVSGDLERKSWARRNPHFRDIIYRKGFDNRELANLHTPRLNRFLAAIAEKVVEMGGEWSINEDTHDMH